MAASITCSLSVSLPVRLMPTIEEMLLLGGGLRSQRLGEILDTP
jgi:hypothetical protein